MLNITGAIAITCCSLMISAVCILCTLELIVAGLD